MKVASLMTDKCNGRGEVCEELSPMQPPDAVSNNKRVQEPAHKSPFLPMRRYIQGSGGPKPGRPFWWWLCLSWN